MRYSFLAALVAGSASAMPALVKKANYDAPSGGDITILNYALTLEYLEREFYRQGIANYTKEQFATAGFDGQFYDNLKEIYYDEQVHVATLAGALGASAVGEAKYKFGVTDAKSFVSLANVLEGVGVSAYLGAAAAIVDKTYLTVAGSILTVEARHSSYIRSKLAQSPFPKPFDTPLDFKQVYSLAAQFITAFPSGSSGLPADPFTPFPAITIEPSRYNYTAGGSPVTFSGAFTNAKAAGLVADANTPVYAVFFSGLDIYYVKARITSTNKDYKIDQIPAGAVGQVYVVLSTADGVNGNKVRDENTISGVGVLEVQPKSYPSVFSG